MTHAEGRCVTREVTRAKPDVFKVLKTYDEPADFSTHLLSGSQGSLDSFCGGESVWTIVSYSVGKIRLGFSFLTSCYFVLVHIHLSLGLLLQQQ